MSDDMSRDEKAVDADLDDGDLAAAELADADVLDADVLDVDVLDADVPDVLDADVPDVLDVDVLDVLDVDVLDADVLEVDLDLDKEIAKILVDPTAPGAPVAATNNKGDDDDDDDVVDLDEELHPDDIEIPLDALLEEKTASAKMEDEEDELEEEEPESDERGDGPTRIMPRRPTEFHCSSCFLLLPRSQLADEERMLCRDCA